MRSLGQALEQVIGRLSPSLLRAGALAAAAAVGFHTSLPRDVDLIDAHAWTMPLSDLHAAMRAIPKVEEKLKHLAFRQMAYSVCASASATRCTPPSSASRAGC